MNDGKKIRNGKKKDRVTKRRGRGEKIIKYNKKK